MTPPSKPPIEQIEEFAQALVAERGPLELLMAFIVHSDPDPRMEDFFGRAKWELALAASWTDDWRPQSTWRAHSLLPGWQYDRNALYGVEISIMSSDESAIDDLLFFMEGQTRRHPELVDVTVGGMCFRRAYVIAHRKAGIGGKLIGAEPVMAD